MAGVSGIVIAKNEENTIADCLDSLSFCDEIIVVDNKSEDRTREVAKRMGAKVVSHETNDFSVLRNLGKDMAKNDWILYVDADERVTPLLRKEIVQLTNDPTGDYEAFLIKRKNFYYGFNEWPYIEKIERLFQKKSLVEWKGILHESPIIHGNRGVLEGYLLHYSHRDLSSMVDKTNKWSEIEATLRFQSSHPEMTWWRFFRVMITAFFDSYVKQGGWKAGTVGLIESIYQAFSMFITYAKLWEMQQKFKNKNAKVKIARLR